MEVLQGVVLVFFVSVLHKVSAASYLYLNETGNYIEGRQLCQNFGLDLAKVSSEQDLEDLHTMYQNITGASVAWLGLRYNGTNFLWPDDSRVQFTAWNNIADDEPDDLDKSHCAVVKWSIMLWHTRLCTRKYPVLCGPFQREDSSEFQDATFSMWRTNQTFDVEPTVSKPETSIGACAKDCFEFGNCVFFSLDGEVCNMYSNITTISTRWTSNNDRIWKREFVNIHE